jgi:hypothetical protein
MVVSALVLRGEGEEASSDAAAAPGLAVELT